MNNSSADKSQILSLVRFSLRSFPLNHGRIHHPAHPVSYIAKQTARELVKFILCRFDVLIMDVTVFLSRRSESIPVGLGVFF